MSEPFSRRSKKRRSSILKPSTESNLVRSESSRRVSFSRSKNVQEYIVGNPPVESTYAASYVDDLSSLRHEEDSKGLSMQSSMEETCADQSVFISETNTGDLTQTEKITLEAVLSGGEEKRDSSGEDDDDDNIKDLILQEAEKSFALLDSSLSQGNEGGELMEFLLFDSDKENAGARRSPKTVPSRKKVRESMGMDLTMVGIIGGEGGKGESSNGEGIQQNKSVRMSMTMDFTRTESSEPYSTNVKNKSIQESMSMDFTRVESLKILSHRNKTVLESAGMDFTLVESPPVSSIQVKNNNKTVCEPASMDFTRVETPPLAGGSSQMQANKTVCEPAGMDFTRVETPPVSTNQLKANKAVCEPTGMDFTRIESPDLFSEIPKNDKKHKTLHEQTEMDLSRVESPDLFYQTERKNKTIRESMGMDFTRAESPQVIFPQTKNNKTVNEPTGMDLTRAESPQIISQQTKNNKSVNEHIGMMEFTRSSNSHSLTSANVVSNKTICDTIGMDSTRSETPEFLSQGNTASNKTVVDPIGMDITRAAAASQEEGPYLKKNSGCIEVSKDVKTFGDKSISSEREAYYFQQFLKEKTPREGKEREVKLPQESEQKGSDQKIPMSSASHKRTNIEPTTTTDIMNNETKDEKIRNCPIRESMRGVDPLTEQKMSSSLRDKRQSIAMNLTLGGIEPDSSVDEDNLTSHQNHHHPSSSIRENKTLRQSIAMNITLGEADSSIDEELPRIGQDDKTQSTGGKNDQNSSIEEEEVFPPKASPPRPFIRSKAMRESMNITLGGQNISLDEENEVLQEPIVNKSSKESVLGPEDIHLSLNVHKAYAESSRVLQDGRSSRATAEMISKNELPIVTTEPLANDRKDAKRKSVHSRFDDLHKDKDVRKRNKAEDLEKNALMDNHVEEKVINSVSNDKGILPPEKEESLGHSLITHVRNVDSTSTHEDSSLNIEKASRDHEQLSAHSEIKKRKIGVESNQSLHSLEGNPSSLTQSINLAPPAIPQKGDYSKGTTELLASTSYVQEPSKILQEENTMNQEDGPSFLNESQDWHSKVKTSPPNSLSQRTSEILTSAESSFNDSFLSKMESESQRNTQQSAQKVKKETIILINVFNFYEKEQLLFSDGCKHANFSIESLTEDGVVLAFMEGRLRICMRLEPIQFREERDGNTLIAHWRVKDVKGEISSSTENDPFLHLALSLVNESLLQSGLQGLIQTTRSLKDFLSLIRPHIQGVCGLLLAETKIFHSHPQSGLSCPQSYDVFFSGFYFNFLLRFSFEKGLKCLKSSVKCVSSEGPVNVGSLLDLASKSKRSWTFFEYCVGKVDMYVDHLNSLYLKKLFSRP